jgi:hypothetical protein
MRGSTLLACCALSALACGRRVSVYLDRPWQKDQIAVIVVENREDALIAGPAILLPSSSVAHEELANPGPIRVFVRTYPEDLRSPLGSTLDVCGVRIGGDTLPLPLQPGGDYASGLFDPTVTREVTLHPASAEEGPPPDLHFACGGPSHECDGYSAERIDAPPGLATHQIATASEGLAYFGTNEPAGASDSPMTLGRIIGTRADVFLVDRRLHGDTKSLAWNPAASVLRGIDGQGRLFALDASAHFVQPNIDGPFNEISIGSDGFAVVLDQNEAALTITSSSGALVPAPGYPAGLRKVAVVDEHRIFATDKSAIFRFDGGTWSADYTIPLNEPMSGFAADEVLAVYVGATEVVRVRDSMTGRWGAYPTPFNTGAKLRAVAGLGDGRFIVVGDAGQIAVWGGTAWCQIESPVRVALGSVAISPSRTAAFIASDGAIGPNGETYLLRVVLPKKP